MKLSLAYICAVCFIGLFHPFGVNAQSFSIKHTGFKDGLSNNSVLSLFQDSKGFVWMGTYDGLNLYDGNSFKVFKNEISNVNSLPDNSIYSISEDHDGKIWIASRHGVSKLERTTSYFEKVYYKSPAGNYALSGNVHHLTYAPHLGMVVATEQNGLILFRDQPVGTVIPIIKNHQLLYNYDASSIALDQRNGDLWFVVNNIGLYHYDKNRKAGLLESTALKSAICSFTQNEEIWIGTANGLFRYHKVTHTLSGNYLPEKIAVTSIGMNGDRIWVGTDGRGLLYTGIRDVEHRDNKWSRLEGLGSNAIYALLNDKNDRLWVGTLRAGCNLLYEDNKDVYIRKLPENNHVNASNFIFSFYEDENSNLWIGTDGNGLTFWDRKSNRYLSYKKDNAGLSSNYITGLVKTDPGHIWISSWLGGVDKLDIHTGKVQPFPLFNNERGTTETNCWFLYRDRKQQLWASTSNTGTLYLFNEKQGKFVVFDSRLKDIQCMQEDAEGKIWLGNYNHLILLDPARKRHVFFKIGYPVRSILDDGQGNLWVGTDGGGLLVIRKKDMHYKRYTNTDGLPGNSVLRLLADNNGYIWLSTFTGLARIDILQRKIYRIPDISNDKKNQYAYNAALKLHSGELLFGGINGFNIINPQLVAQAGNHPSAACITNVRIGNAANPMPFLLTDGDKKIPHFRIPYNKAASVIFNYSVPEFLNPEQIQYKYKLENWDKEWSLPTNVKTVNYSQLRPGTYHFEIANSDAGNNWGAASTLAILTILPPWYATWWAYALYLLIFSGLVLLFIHYVKYKQRMRYELRIAHLENKEQKERNERKISYFTNISHELRGPLTLIINPLKELLKIHRPEDSPDEKIKTAYKNARRLLALVDQLMLFRKADENADELKKKNFLLDDMIREICSCYDMQARLKHIDFHYPQEKTSLQVEADKEKLEIILFNLLSNAFKYTPENGNIHVEYTIAGQNVIISVMDTGKGIPSGTGNAIFEKFRQGQLSEKGFGIGLYLVKHFSRLHNGSVAYRSETGKGSTFLITLPIVCEEEKKTADYNLTEKTVFPGYYMNDLPEPEEISLRLEEKKTFPLSGLERNVSAKQQILVVDDDKDLLAYLQELLKNRFQVWQAVNGEEAIQVMEKRVPDLILCDIQMAGMDGIAFCQTVKTSEKWAHIPVILLTALTSEEMERKGVAAGADGYITKPFDNEILQLKINGILENRTKLQQYFFDRVTLKENNDKVPQAYLEFLQNCISVIEQNLDKEDFDIGKFSQIIGMSHSSLYKKVKLVSGQSVNSFIRSIRLRRAAILMLKENYSVGEAAFQVGIGDLKYFREQFRKQFGMNPSEYIKRYKASFQDSCHIVVNG